ncbi:MAG: hypothetical protein KGS61_12610, partial [Verrucomicrobia bacterium]|nr:hypothetical protein [Verrucomicrobiota bacterium]
MRYRIRNMSFGVLAALAMAIPSSSKAGSFQADFNTDPSAILNFGGSLWDGVTTSHTGTAKWIPSGGAGPFGTTTNGPVLGQTNDGFLQLTFGDPSCSGTLGSYEIGGVLFTNFDGNLIVQAFTFECDLRIGNGNPNPADGFSINYCANNDPVVLALQAGDTFADMNNQISSNGGQFSDNGNSGDTSLAEEGTSTGLAIGFDLWDSGDYTIPPNPPAIGLVAQGITHDGIGLDIRVDDVLIDTFSMPDGTTQGTRDQFGNSITGANSNGDPTGTDYLAIETGLHDGTGCNTNLYWVHFKAVLDTNGFVNVWWKNHQIITNLQANFLPTPGRLLMAARVGGNAANIDVDNIQITTIPAHKVLIGALKGTATGFTVETEDSGGVTAETNSFQLTLNGTGVSPTYVNKDTNGITTVAYKNSASPSPAGATNVVTISLKDNNGETIGPATLTYVVPGYLVLPASFAVTNVDTSQPGFLVKAYQVTNNLDNEINLAEAVLHGDYGPNVATLTAFTNGPNHDAYVETNVINYAIYGSDGVTLAAAGDYQQRNDANGNPLPIHQNAAGNPSSGNVPDVIFPGIPGAALPNGAQNQINFTEEVRTYLQFPKPGLYKLTVNSDDGCRLEIGDGNAARDQFSGLTVVQFDGGRGTSDSTQTLYVPQAGFYAVRILYFQGGGGAGLEFSAVNDDGPAGADGTTALVNDSFPGALSAYRACSQPAPVTASYVTPVPGITQSVRPENGVYVELTDGATATVNGGSISLTVNGAPVQATVAKNGSVTSVSYSPPGGAWPQNTASPAGDNWPPDPTVTCVLTFADNSTPPVTRTNAWSFNTMEYRSVPPSLALPASAVDTTKGGFLDKA